MAFLDFLENVSESQASLISYLDNELMSISGVSRKIRYRIPFYDHGTWFCYLNPVKKDKVELCFLKGRPMLEHFPMLKMNGRKMISGMMLNADEDIPIALIINMTTKAIELNSKS